MQTDPTAAAWASIGRPLSRLAYDDLPGFAEDDHAAAFACLLRSAQVILADSDPLRSALPPPPGLRSVAQAALAIGEPCPGPVAKAFFQQHFTPYRVGGADGFLTGYYEPVVDGALEPGPAFTAPILGRPDDLVTLAPGDARPDDLQGFAAARRGPDGRLARYPDRAAIEQAVLAGEGRPVVWLRDWVEAFLVQVQGSARVRLPGGVLRRLTYAGRNGHPYTSIGRLLVEQGAIAPEAMSLDGLKAWLRENGQGPGERGRAMMQRNASFIFFELEARASPEGPVGGAGHPLTPLRSIAVDRSIWCYGLPFWIEADLPWRGATPERFARLMLAQDTGSAIVGPARADLFFGSGEQPGRWAGGIRHKGRCVVLLPTRAGAGP